MSQPVKKISHRFTWSDIIRESAWAQWIRMTRPPGSRITHTPWGCILSDIPSAQQKIEARKLRRAYESWIAQDEERARDAELFRFWTAVFPPHRLLVEVTEAYAAGLPYKNILREYRLRFKVQPLGWAKWEAFVRDPESGGGVLVPFRGSQEGTSR